MISITPNDTVADVARAFPAAIRLFEQYGIDFCCGGQRRIGDICRERGISFEDLVGNLEKQQQASVGPPAADWSSAPLSQLIHHIVSKHHAYLKRELPRLLRMLAKVTEVHGAKHGKFLVPLGKTYTVFCRDLEDHMWKEENVLFPLILRMEEARKASPDKGLRVSVDDPIRVMEFEHRSTGNALDQMRRLTNHYETPPDGCATFRGLMEGLKEVEADLHQHIHLENNILFPRAIVLED
jgi:regulator of cell morphogenesis and NO signaling